MKPLPITRMASSHTGQSVGVAATATAAYARDTPELAAVMRHASVAAAAAVPNGTPTATAGESSAGRLLVGSHGAATAASAATPEKESARAVAAGGSALVAA